MTAPQQVNRIRQHLEALNFPELTDRDIAKNALAAQRLVDFVERVWAIVDDRRLSRDQKTALLARLHEGDQQ